jgi:flagellar hook-associated protein 2
VLAESVFELHNGHNDWPGGKLNVGSPITLSGFNNIDFNAITQIIIKSERQPITRLEADKKTEQTRLTAYGTFNSSLSALQPALEALKSADAFGELKATSSDTTVLTATATSSATQGTFTLNVISLARPQVTASAANQFSDINATIFDSGGFSITQNGVTTNIDLTGVDSLAELRDAINAQQTGVKASIINDGSGSTPFRLVLTSANAGESNAFTVNDSLQLGAGNPGQVLNLSTDATNGVAKDTEFTYNGITVKSTSTTVSDAIPGLNLTLLKVGVSSVTVTEDDASLKTKIKALVTAFNSFGDFVGNQTKLDTTGAGRPPLANDPLLRSVNRTLRNYLVSSHANSGSIDHVSDLGLTLDRDGKLQVDEAALDAALANNRSDVAAFFAEETGFASRVADVIKGYTQTGGAIDTIKVRITDSINKFTVKIQDLEARLIIREQQLTAEFAAADRAISQLNSQGSSLAGLFSQFRLF